MTQTEKLMPDGPDPKRQLADVDFAQQRIDGETWSCDEPFDRVFKAAPGKKDTRRWCKGKVGREHRPVIDIPPQNLWMKPCLWRLRWSWRGHDRVDEWVCRHVERCSVCGRVLKHSHQLLAEQCPNYAPREPT